MTEEGAEELQRTERLSALTARLVERYEITVEYAAGSFWAETRIIPEAGACPMSWIELRDDEVIYGLGTGGCRWELQPEPDDLAFIEQLAHAAAAGDVSEVFGPGRSQITVRIAGGETVQTRQYDAPRGLLPAPKWKRRGRRIDYGPYPPARASFER